MGTCNQTANSQEAIAALTRMHNAQVNMVFGALLLRHKAISLHDNTSKYPSVIKKIASYIGVFISYPCSSPHFHQHSCATMTWNNQVGGINHGFQTLTLYKDR